MISPFGIAAGVVGDRVILDVEYGVADREVTDAALEALRMPLPAHGGEDTASRK